MKLKEKISHEKIQEVIETLQGTCKGLCEVLEDMGYHHDSPTVWQLNEIDQSLFLCDNCGWWYEMGEDFEYEDMMVCRNCYVYDFDMDEDNAI